MRKIYMAGMSHKVAEIAVREKFYIPMDVKSEALAHSPFDELLILATCNRTEVYVASDRDIGEAELVRYVCDLARQNYEDFAKFFYFKSGDEVAHHVMNVCAGLDSVAVGEDQILHQIGRAYETALKFGATGNSLNKLFQGAIHTTKRIKTETNLSKLSCNIPFLAMKQVQHSFDDLENRTVYIVGLGEMGSLMLKYVQENTTKIFASSRTFANAQKFADVLTPVKFEDRYQVLGQCDVVILCSACQEPIVTKKDFAEAIGGADANKAARLVIDLGSPRNAEASIGELPGVQYVCVDDLEKIVSENRRLRMVELEAAQKILKEGLDEFLQWYRMDDIAKEIHLLAEKTVQTADMECEKLLRSLPEVSEVDRSRIQMMYVRFAKKMVNEYLYKVKECNPLDDVRTYLKCLRGGK
ncbi:glutamyl-tRNA reductase [uncultured Fibrobacter sp.]|uniref:glutamyl-tRNA reductase n=1 Tax=uncultured Fibrobacter sp. TaxID=261512 RepID=UPI0025D95E95|nr:glutamyl-tRNA reductase [uncultured Fibrobacter sp.]MBO4713352.1 glutamyl-tRNA reductase [Fibrobacter sp.]